MLTDDIAWLVRQTRGKNAAKQKQPKCDAKGKENMQ